MGILMFQDATEVRFLVKRMVRMTIVVIQNSMIVCTSILTWENSPHFVTPPLVLSAKWRRRNERRNFILMTCHYPVLGNASDWSCCEGNLLQPIRSITQIWVVTGHQYGIPALVSQTSFREETRSGVAKCRQFSQTTCIPDHSCNLARATHPSTQ